MAQFRFGIPLTGGTHCESRNGGKNDRDLPSCFSILSAALRVVFEPIFNQVCICLFMRRGKGFPIKNPNDNRRRSHLQCVQHVKYIKGEEVAVAAASSWTPFSDND